MNRARAALAVDLQGSFLSQEGLGIDAVVRAGQADPEVEEFVQAFGALEGRDAQVVAFVRNCDDVTHALRYAKAAGLPIAVRGGGGHNTAGCSSIEGGLVIDLSRHLNRVSIDPEKKVAYVQGGAVGATVDKEAIKYGLATVCGTVNHVSKHLSYVK